MKTTVTSFDRVVLFTGHMIDAPGRPAERFPARIEAAARLAIERSLQALVPQHDRGRVAGIAGGASGGDILFHEVCGELQIPTRLRLALPVEEFMDTSVAPAGEEWVRRFHDLLQRLGPASVKVFDDSATLPDWLTDGASLNIWQRANLEMMLEATQLAPKRTLLALWDGAPGDGPGGTEHLVSKASQFGFDVAPVIRTQFLFVPE